MNKETTIKLYAARDKNTGKFVRDITNPGHKFWEKKKCCEQAIENYNNRNKRYGPKYDLEMVEVTCVESDVFKTVQAEAMKAFWNALIKRAEFTYGGDQGFSFEIKHDVALDLIEELAQF